MEILLTIIIIWLFLIQLKVNDLKKTITELKGEQPKPLYSSIPQAPTKEQQAAFAQMLREQQSSAQFTPAVVPQHDSSFSLSDWFKEDAMMKVGALLLLIAFGWFVSYAFANNWIGPVGRVSLGIAVGVLIMAGGWWRMRFHEQQGAVFLVLGSTTVLLTLYASRELYNFLTPAIALLGMFATVASVAYSSVLYNRKDLALLSLVMAGAAPLLVATTDPSVVMLNLYLLVVVLGTLLVVYLRSWSLLTFSAFCLVCLYGLPVLIGGQGEIQTQGLLFAFLFTGVFLIANIIGLIGNETEENKQYHLLISLGTGVYLIFWIYSAAAPLWHSLLFFAWMLIFAAASLLIYRTVTSLIPFLLYAATSVALLGAATAAALNGETLVIALCLEILALIVASNIVLKKIDTSTYLAGLFAIPAVLSFGSLSQARFEAGIFQADFAVLMVLFLSLATAGYSYRQNQLAVREVSMTLLTLSAVYALAIIWLVLHAGTLTSSLAYQRATMVTLVIYTVLGIGSYIFGIQQQRKALSQFGAFLVGAVVVRLLLVDVWDMELTARIITFFTIGVLLISTAFIRRGQTKTD